MTTTLKWILVGSIILAIGYSSLMGHRLYKSYKQFQILNEEYAFITKINFGLFNIKEWRAKALDVFSDQVTQFEIGNEAYGEVNKELEKYLYRVYQDYIASGKLFDGMFAEAEKNTKVNKFLLNMLKDNVGPQIEQLNIPKYIPNMAKQLSAELRKNEPRIKEVLQGELQKMMVITDRFPQQDPRAPIFEKYKASNLNEAKAYLISDIEMANQDIYSQVKHIYILLLSICLIAVILSNLIDISTMTSLLSLTSVVFLALGISLPMINIDARLNSFIFSLFNKDLAFEEQTIFYQSKSILQVTQTLLDGKTIDLKVVGILILLFSIIFPALKLLLSATYSYSSVLKHNKVVKGFIYYLGKWSMADVFVVSMLMAYIGFYGLVDAQLGQIERNKGGFGIETVNYSSLAPGALFFTTYCILSIITGIIISRKEA